MDEKYFIDIESPDGTVVTGECRSLKEEIDVELPEGYGVSEAPSEDSGEQKKVYADKMLKNKREHLGMKAKTRISNTVIYVVLILLTFVWIIPFVCIVLESFRCESTSQVGYIIPKQWGLDNYIRLFTQTQFLTWFKNTFIMGVAVSVIQTCIVLSVSYALSRLRFKMRKAMMNFMLILGMFPGFLTLILLYKLLNDFSLTGTNAVWGLILVYVASSGMGYYISKGYFDTIPKSLDEAARVDGATRFQVFYKIILPMAKPIVIYTVLMGFMAPWGDFVLASYIAHNTTAGMNVAVGLQNLISTSQSLSANYTTFCAGGVIVALPITLLFMFLQKYYVEGVTGGAVKG